MSAATSVLQLVRAHYRADPAGFASAAMSLARGAKSPAIRNTIELIVREGVAAERQGRRDTGDRRDLSPPRPLESLSGGMLQELPPVTFEELLLETGLQLLLDEIVTELEYREDLAARRLRARNRLLFHGPPGNGKSSAAVAIARALDLTAFAVSLPQLIDKYVGATGQNLGAMFAELRPNTVVVFDELDAVASTRGAADQAASKEFNSIANTLLTLLDRNKTGIVVATTNRLDIIDPAVLRRFDISVAFPAPSVPQMRALANKLCDGFEIPIVDDVLLGDCGNFDAVAKVVEREARRIAMREILAAEQAVDNEREQQDGKEEE